MENFAAIDFETANQYRSSVCSVGLVVVRNAKVVEKFYELIHPTPDFYSYWNTRVHGLTEEDTRDASDFPDVWAEISPLIEGLPLVAHNSPFDESCLRAVFQTYEMPYPNYAFHCTCRAARVAFHGMLPNFQLQTVAHICGYNLRNHHHALADAEACAQIALKILRD